MPLVKIRLHKAIAEAGLASRRAAERLIAQGRVTVNGRVVTAMGTSVDPASDLVLVDGVKLPSPGKRRYILLYKPGGVLCSRKDPQGRKTVYDLLPEDMAQGLHSVGRLDYDAEGLLLFTDDGALTQALTHPGKHVQKVYLVKFKGKVSPSAVSMMRKGVDLEDGKTLPAEVDPVEVRGTPRNSWLRIALREGRRNQIKRMGEAVGHQVLRIVRIQIGPLKLPEQLGRGQYRHLKGNELRALLGAAWGAGQDGPKPRVPPSKAGKHPTSKVQISKRSKTEKFKP